MKQFTKEQRRNIYLEVAELLYESNYHICGQLAKHIFVDGWGDAKCTSQEITSTFAEFALFKPEHVVTDRDIWFESSDERLFCMLLCAEMCR